MQSRVISVHSWYLTSLITSLSIDLLTLVTLVLDCSPSISINYSPYHKFILELYMNGRLMLSTLRLFFEVYLYIGITSLCLYNNAEYLILQDGILYKLNKNYLCKWIKLWNITKTQLTNEHRFDMLTMLGGLYGRPSFLLH